VRRQGWELLDRSRIYGSITVRAHGFPFDLETHVGAPFMCGLSVEDMLGRCTRKRHPLGFEHHHPELHDHALLLAMNVYKDRVLDTAVWAVRDLERIVLQEDFRAESMAGLARRARVTTAVSVLARWLASERGSEPWGEVARLLRPLPRPGYARAMERVLRRREGISQLRLRTLARQSSDSRLRRVAALSVMAAYGLARHPWRNVAA